jgi:predicted Rossmann-fold nucleotide-binding protein
MHFLSRVSLITKTFFNTMHSHFQLIHGIWKISNIKGPIVSIFGGAQVPIDDIYTRQAHLLAQKIVALHINIMTGGGTGIMQAANCGALKNQQTMSIGIGIKEFEYKNPCMKQYIEVNQRITTGSHCTYRQRILARTY